MEDYRLKYREREPRRARAEMKKGKNVQSSSIVLTVSRLNDT
jgi:hypothetical protein